MTIEPWGFLNTLSETNPAYAAAMCKEILAGRPPLLSRVYSNLLYKIRAVRPAEAVSLCQRAIATNDVTIQYAVARAYGSSDWLEQPEPGEVELVQDLLRLEDLDIRASAILALKQLGRNNPRLAVELMRNTDIAKSKDLAKNMCEAFDQMHGISPNALTDEDIGVLLGKLRLTASIEDYSVSEFLALASKKVPRAVAEFLLARIARAEEVDEEKYDPLPYLEFHHKLTGIAEAEDYPDLLRRVRDQALSDTWKNHFWLPKLFEEISQKYNATSLAVLNEWINSGVSAKIEAAAMLLGEAPNTFAFDQQQFAINCIQKAYAAGEETYRRVCSALNRSVISGVRSGTPGQPMPQDVAQHDRASAIAATLVSGSPEHKFYASLADDAEAFILQKLARDEEFLDQAG